MALVGEEVHDWELFLSLEWLLFWESPHLVIDLEEEDVLVLVHSQM